MNQAEKAMLRTISLLRQSTSAMGDMARTLDQPANQFRVLKAQVTLFGRAVGDLLLPIVQKVLPYMIAFVKVAQRAVMAFAKLAGFELPKFDYGDSVDNITAVGDAADDAAASVKKLYTLSFDELNILGSQNSSGSGSGTSAEDLAKLEAELNRLAKIENDAFSAALGENADKIAESMENWLTKGAGIEKWAANIATKFTNIKNTAEKVANQLGLWKIPAALSALLSSLGLNIDFGTVNADFSGTKLGKVSGEDALHSLLGNGLGIALGIGALAALTGDGGSLLAKGIGLALGIGAVKMLLDDTKLGEVDSSSKNGLLESFRSGLILALAGASLTLLSGKGLSYALGIGLSIAGLKLYFDGIADSSQEKSEPMLAAVKKATGLLLGGLGIAGIFTKDGKLNFTGIGISLGLASASLIWQGAEMFADGDASGALATALGVLMFSGAAGITAAKAGMGAVAALGGGLFAAAIGVSLTITLSLEKVKADSNGSISQKLKSLIMPKDYLDLEENMDSALSYSDYGAVAAGVKKADELFSAQVNKTNNELEKGALSKAENYVDNFTKGLDNGLTKHKKDMERASQKMAEAIDSQFREELGIHSPSTVFAEHGLNIDQGLANGVVDNLDIITDAFGNVYSQIELRFDSFASSMLTKAQSFVSQLSQVLSSASMSGTGSLRTSFSNRVPAYASGGFPEDGMFYANSHELVGRFSNGRTAVANNSQIISGIADGVREANGDLTGVIYSVARQIVQAVQNGSEIYIDGAKIGKTVTNAQNRSNRMHGASQQNV